MTVPKKKYLTINQTIQKYLKDLELEKKVIQELIEKSHRHLQQNQAFT